MHTGAIVIVVVDRQDAKLWFQRKLHIRHGGVYELSEPLGPCGLYGLPICNIIHTCHALTMSRLRAVVMDDGVMLPGTREVDPEPGITKIGTRSVSVMRRSICSAGNWQGVSGDETARM
jgi:hypothetical protein